MRMKYHFPALSRRQRVLMEYLLLDGVEKQKWYSVVHLKLWNGEGLVGIQ